MDAEIIRDHLLSISGNLDLKLYGPSSSLKAAPQADEATWTVCANQARRPKRTLPPPSMCLFRTPPEGTRDVTTTPGQSITLLNSPFVQHQARTWAGQAQAAVSKRLQYRRGALQLHARLLASEPRRRTRRPARLHDSRTAEGLSSPFSRPPPRLRSRGVHLSAMNRRHLLQSASLGFGWLGLSHLANAAALKPQFPPKAKSVILCYMSGGISQVDSFDPKPLLRKFAAAIRCR